MWASMIDLSSTTTDLTTVGGLVIGVAIVSWSFNKVLHFMGLRK